MAFSFKHTLFRMFWQHVHRKLVDIVVIVMNCVKIFIHFFGQLFSEPSIQENLGHQYLGVTHTIYTLGATLSFRRGLKSSTLNILAKNPYSFPPPTF